MAMASSLIRVFKSRVRFFGRSTPSSYFGAETRLFSSASRPPLERVGFIGLGNMGFHMANNLLKAGYNLIVHDSFIPSVRYNGVGINSG